MREGGRGGREEGREGGREGAEGGRKGGKEGGRERRGEREGKEGLTPAEGLDIHRRLGQRSTNPFPCTAERESKCYLSTVENRSLV